MTQPVSKLENILALDCNGLVNELYSYVIQKQIAQHPLKIIEEEVCLVLSLLLIIEMDGFIDVFHQQYSLRQCEIIEQVLRKLQIEPLASLFTYGKQIFVNGKTNITEAEYQAIDPFDGDPRWKRFDAIEGAILAPQSGIYMLSDKVCFYIRAHKDQFLHAKE